MEKLESATAPSGAVDLLNAEEGAKQLSRWWPRWDLLQRWMGFHALSMACVSTVYIAANCFEDGVKLMSFHPLAMAIGWFVFMPLAINSQQADEDLTSKLFPLKLRSARHWVLRGATTALVSAGFVAVLLDKIYRGQSYFITLHGVFGLVSMILMYLTFSGRIAALCYTPLKNGFSAINIKFIHGVAGVVTFCFGIGAISFGANNYIVADKDERQLCTMSNILTGVVLAVNSALNIYMCLKKNSEKNAIQSKLANVMKIPVSLIILTPLNIVVETEGPRKVETPIYFE